MNFWGIKALGAAYLVWMSLHFFYEQRHPKDGPKPQTVAKPKQTHFWRTVASIEALDIVFSVDSILAALAVDNNPVIVLIGGCLGILAMRFVAQVITDFITKVPELEVMAYALIFIIAVKLALSLPQIGIEVPNWAFSVIVALAFLITWLIHQRRATRNQQQKRGI